MTPDSYILWIFLLQYPRLLSMTLSTSQHTDSLAEQGQWGLQQENPESSLDISEDSRLISEHKQLNKRGQRSWDSKGLQCEWGEAKETSQ